MRLLLILLALTIPASASTWYVRTDGGTRYSASMTGGRCNGLADAPDPGSGTNVPCAFKDVRYFWQDGSYTTSSAQSAFPAYGWVGAGGDTYIIRGSIADGKSYRVGWNNNSTSYDAPTAQFWGVQGDKYGSGAPPPLSGTAGHPTRILGGNYASCSAQSARTQLHGGWEVTNILNVQGSSYVEIQCLDLTDFSACGKSGQTKGCGGEDYATNGILMANTSDHLTLTNIRAHGLYAGLFGSTGDGSVFDTIDLLGNNHGAWDADLNNGTVGKGSLLVTHFNFSWSGCAEEYPIVDSLPYGDCTDSNSGGYGDAFGTATVTATSPWNVHFDQGITSYNTQDGLDALHLIGAGSTMTITRVLSYGNMGQQVKIGGSGGVATNNVLVGNCYAMAHPIPGTPADYNSKLTGFCRGSSNNVFISVANGAKTVFTFNTLIQASLTAVNLACDSAQGACDGTTKLDYRNNIFIGFPDDAAHGDSSPNPRGDNPTPIYQCISTTDCNPEQALNSNIFGHNGSFFANNATLGAKANWTCPSTYETNALCGSPNLNDQTWHGYGYPSDARPASATIGAGGHGVTIAGLTFDYNGFTRAAPPSIGALEYNSVATVVTPPVVTPPASSTPVPCTAAGIVNGVPVKATCAGTSLTFVITVTATP